MEPRFAQIGKRFKGIESIEYESNRTFLDFDMLFVDLDYIKERARGLGIISIDVIRARREELEEFRTFKAIPIVTMSPIVDRITLMDNSATRPFTAESVFKLFPDGPVVKRTSKQGEDVLIVPNTPFTSLLEEYKQLFDYHSVFEQVEGQSIATTPNGKTIGFYNTDLIVLPQMENLTASLQKQFFQKLYEVAKQIGKLAKKEPLPRWATKYQLPGEVKLINECSNIETQIAKLQEALQVKQQAIQEKEAFKQLFTATGPSLEQAVLNVLLDLDLDAEEGEKGRADLLFYYGEKVGVIEIKGVTKSAAEDHAARLEKWVAMYYDDNKHHAKGILIVNPFQQTELKDRDPKAFPHQMLKYSEGREHCLITTTQLLGLYFECKAHPERREALIQSLFETVGIYQGFEDWKAFITVREDS